MERYALQLLRCYLGDELDPEIEIKMLQDGILGWDCGKVTHVGDVFDENSLLRANRSQEVLAHQTYSLNMPSL